MKEKRYMKEQNYKLTVREIIEITKGKMLIGNQEEIVEDFCRDSRKVKEGDTYLGIKGENFNGSTYFEEAFSKGAKNSDIIVKECNSNEETINEINKIKKENDYILLKASNRMHF